ncbi:hypothetical protein RQP46_003697 [Phenoliferia psychrophenolica]
MADGCVFCAIISGKLPSYKLYETPKTLAFLDARPISHGHLLVVPKYHAAKLTSVPDEDLSEILGIVKKLAIAVGCEDFNVLQSNGKIAMQTVGHVHFHMIPKTADEGLLMRLPDEFPVVDLAKVQSEIKSKL